MLEATASTSATAVSPLSVTPALNKGLPVHDWYLMPEAYSESLILEAIERFGLSKGETVLDPFSGTGTTAVTAVLNGFNAVGLEVNPFLAFAATVKLDWDIDVSQFKQIVDEVLSEAQPLLDAVSVEQDMFAQALPATVRLKASDWITELDIPQMPKLEKWMSRPVVHKILFLERIIKCRVPARLQSHFILALAAIMRPASNMKLTAHAFGSNTQKTDSPVFDLYAQKIRKIASDLDLIQLSGRAFGKGTILNVDSRAASHVPSPLLPASLLITSPPYLNNLDYTMQTRMELFFLRFVKDMAGLRDLRKTMVTCDAKAMYKDVPDSEEVKDVASIQRVADSLREVHADKNWGWDYAYMTTQYFGGMRRVLRALQAVMKPGARFVLIVGDSSHSGVRIPLAELLAELGELEGYTLEAINDLRTRRSSSHNHVLRESEVILQKRLHS